jgi:hypothetical protein
LVIPAFYRRLVGDMIDCMKWDWATVLIVAVVGIAVGEIVRLLGQAVAVLQQIRDILQSVTSGPPKHLD